MFLFWEAGHEGKWECVFAVGLGYIIEQAPTGELATAQVPR